MATSNPALNDKIFNREIESQRRAGYSPGTFGSPAPGSTPPRAHHGQPAGPTGTGPIVDPDVMRVGGVASATIWLALVLGVAAWFGWNAVKVATVVDQFGQTQVTSVSIPTWIWPAWIAGLVLAIVTILKPKIAMFTATLYAIAEGLLLGAISQIFNVQYQGIVLQAVMLTGAVFAIMWTLFITGTIEVTQKLRIGVMVATGAVFLLYALSLLLGIFGVHMPLINDSGPLGIAISLVIVGIAAFNLLLDFDFVQRAVAAKAPRYMEWYAAFGLMVTLIWLYLELLRLLAKLRN